MGRWGNRIYDSDPALNYFDSISDKLEAELVCGFSPDLVIDDGSWLENILTVIEVILLFEKDDIGSSVYLHQLERVSFWQETFLKVWDGDWVSVHTFPRLSDDPAYRQQHRPAVINLFEEPAILTHGKTDSTMREALFPLPHFSLFHEINKNGKETVSVAYFISELKVFLEKDIIYWLSSEKRVEVNTFNDEEVWVAVDILGLLCQHYEQSPGVNQQVIHNWRNTSIEITKSFSDSDWNETDELYRNVMIAFDRLEAMAKKYPPQEFWSS